MPPEPDFQKLKRALAAHNRALTRIVNSGTLVTYFEVHHGGKKHWFRDLESVAAHHQTLEVLHDIK
ncbi:hypothetical protein BLL52_3978 [Rhodoferax antarcticus ANT.BR]|uniref:Uncharacterized protein n=2 Tax=Rhodoferax antarcticus TaxID=81479 RepID=A0A1Q8YAY8_9BURK|nr:hypothetical protein BLL52_3978 [Rhodoferax antarcticus ANT.BR]